MWLQSTNESSRSVTRAERRLVWAQHFNWTHAMIFMRIIMLWPKCSCCVFCVCSFLFVAHKLSRKITPNYRQVTSYNQLHTMIFAPKNRSVSAVVGGGVRVCACRSDTVTFVALVSLAQQFNWIWQCVLSAFVYVYWFWILFFSSAIPNAVCTSICWAVSISLMLTPFDAAFHTSSLFLLLFVYIFFYVDSLPVHSLLLSTL